MAGHSTRERFKAMLKWGDKNKNDVDEQKLPATKSPILSAESNPQGTGDHGKPEPPGKQQPNLWDRAYNELKKSKPRLVDKYERLLSEQLDKVVPATSVHAGNDATPPNKIREEANARRAQMDAIIDACEKRPKSELRQATEKAGQFIAYFQDWIDKGVQASPEASMVWAGVSMVLPLLTNAKNMGDSQTAAFAYVTSRISFYTKLDRVFLAGTPADDVKTKMEDDLAAMYQSMIEVQVLSVLRAASPGKAFLKDSLGLGDWEGSLKSIKDKEETIDRDMSTVNMTAVRDTMAELKDIQAASKGAVLSLAAFAPRLLEVQAEGVALSRDAAEKAMSDEEMKCLRAFAPNAQGKKSYLDFKAGIADAIEGTCQWFCRQESFKSWLNDSSGSLLVTAGPGCGKSVLTKYVIDHILPKSNGAVCYFFFRDTVQNSLTQALSALLHQLLSRYTNLIKHAMRPFAEHGAGLANSTELMLDILQKVIGGEVVDNVVIVIDALDECQKDDHRDLVRFLKRFIGDTVRRNVRFFLTGRPYDSVESMYEELEDVGPCIKVPGNEHSEEIGKEINLVVRERMRKFAKTKKLKANVKEILEEKLVGGSDDSGKTYLWVYLVFDYLEHHSGLKFTAKGVSEALATLPSSVDDAYEKILSRSSDPDLGRKVFCILLAARRSLSIAELQAALEITDKITKLEDLDLEESEEHFVERLSECCGLLITIVSGRIAFLHKTVRQFLENTDGKNDPSQRWRGTVTPSEAHQIIGQCCVSFLLLEELQSHAASFKSGFKNVFPHPYDWHSKFEDSRRFSNHYPFVEYAGFYWDYHVRESKNAEFQTDPRCLALCDMNGVGPWLWLFKDCAEHRRARQKVHLGFELEYPQMPEGNPANWGAAEIEAIDNDVLHVPVNTQLWLHAFVGFERLVERDLHQRNEVNKGRTMYERPLTPAVINGHRRVFVLLLNHGALVDDKLIVAVAAGESPEMVEYLPALMGGEINFRNLYDEETVLHLVRNAEVAKAIAKYSTPSDIDARDKAGNTPLLSFTYRPEIAKVLLDFGADVNAKNLEGETLLSKTTDIETAKLLLSRGADPNTKDNAGKSPLHEVYSVKMAQLLLDNGADIHASSNSGRTVLFNKWANEELFDLLLDMGADPNASDENGYTPIMIHAVGSVYHDHLEGEITSLIEHGADLDAISNDGRTVLEFAPTEKTFLLIWRRMGSPKGILSNGTSALGIAIRSDRPTAVVKIMLREGASLTACTNAGWNPLDEAIDEVWNRQRWFRSTPHIYVVAVLIRAGAHPGKKTPKRLFRDLIKTPWYLWRDEVFNNEIRRRYYGGICDPKNDVPDNIMDGVQGYDARPKESEGYSDVSEEEYQENNLDEQEKANNQNEGGGSIDLPARAKDSRNSLDEDRSEKSDDSEAREEIDNNHDLTDVLEGFDVNEFIVDDYEWDALGLWEIGDLIEDSDSLKDSLYNSWRHISKI